MYTLSFALLLSTTAASSAGTSQQNPTNVQLKNPATAAAKSADSALAKGGAAKEDCDSSAALMKKLNADQKATDSKEQKAASDQAVSGLANLGVLPAEKVEEKKPDPVIAAPKMENCQ